MSIKKLNTGQSANDGTGDTLRNSMIYIDNMMSELYDLRNKIIDLNSFIIGDDDDMYAHESQIIITTINNRQLLFLLYISDKVTSTEAQLTSRAILKVYNLLTKEHLKTFSLFYAGLNAGITMDSDKIINVPRMYITGTTLKLFCPNNNNLFTRNIEITDIDPNNWTPSNISVAQMTMKNSSGNNVLVDVTSANVQTHLNYIFGDTYAGYANLMPMFRNIDQIAKSGVNWYGTLELSSEYSHNMARPTLVVISTDSGGTWALGSAIGYTTLGRVELIETALFFLGTNLHAVTRNNLHYKSTDNGATWILQTPVSSMANFTVYQAKPSAINCSPIGYGETIFLAIQQASEITGNVYRTTLGIYKTSDMLTFTEVTKFVTQSYAHYPCLHYFNNSLYVSYTKGLKTPTNDRDTINITKLI